MIILKYSIKLLCGAFMPVYGKSRGCELYQTIKTFLSVIGVFLTYLNTMHLQVHAYGKSSDTHLATLVLPIIKTYDSACMEKVPTHDGIPSSG